MIDQPGSDELAVSTPELVTFRYDVAGIGTRFLAQAIDACLLLAGLLEVILVAVLVGTLTSGPAGLALGVVLAFLLVMTYFPLFELAWAGQTPGKRALGVRVTGLHGEPPDRTQLVIRNLLRLIDFLPAYYGIGIVAMFVSRNSRRLGDLAAGTLVVRDRQSVSFRTLEARMEGDAPIGSDAFHGLEPNLRQLVLSYAARRYTLTAERRLDIAAAAAGPLSAAAPAAYAAGGPLAALDALADPIAPTGAIVTTMPRARRSLVAGAIACIALVVCPPVTILAGIYALVLARSAIAELRTDAAGLVTGRAEAEVGLMLAVVSLAALLIVLVTSGLIVAAGVRP